MIEAQTISCKAPFGVDKIRALEAFIKPCHIHSLEAQIGIDDVIPVA